MKRSLQLLAIFCCCFFLWGCPYESEVALCERHKAYDAALSGKWVTAGEATTVYELTSSGDEYHIAHIDVRNGNTDNFMGFICEVNGVPFLHVYDKADAIPKYSIYRLEVKNNDKIILRAVSEKLDETFTSSARFYEFVAKRMDYPSFYNGETEYIRKK